MLIDIFLSDDGLSIFKQSNKGLFTFILLFFFYDQIINRRLMSCFKERPGHVYTEAIILIK